MISLFNQLIVKLSFIIYVFLLNSCINTENFKSIISNKEVVSKELILGSFEKINISNSCNVEVVRGNSYKVEYSDYENVIDNLIFEVKENQLLISSKKPENDFFSNSVAKSKIFIVGNLNEISISGSGEINVKDKNITPNLKCSILGSGDINIQNNESQHVDVDIVGSGDVNLKSGDIKDANCVISGSGSIDLVPVKVIQARCVISGSGLIKINVLKELEGNISGSGSIEYTGNPKIVSRISGSGEVIPLKK
jgi:hypothetical protein